MDAAAHHPHSMGKQQQLLEGSQDKDCTPPYPVEDSQLRLVEHKMCFEEKLIKSKSPSAMPGRMLPSLGKDESGVPEPLMDPLIPQNDFGSLNRSIAAARRARSGNGVADNLSEISPDAGYFSLEMSD